MATFISLVNRVLQKCGENKVSSVLLNNVSELAAQVVNDSILAVAAENNRWPFLEKSLNADSWINEQASMDSRVAHVFSISHRPTDAPSSPICYVSHETLLGMYNYEYAEGGRPTYYSEFAGKFYFNPYPPSEDERNKIWFHCTFEPDTLVADDDELPWANSYILLLVTRAAMSFAMEHMNDASRGQQFAGEYQRMLMQLKHRYTDTKDTNRSMIA
jgi:hypothetical protein